MNYRLRSSYLKPRNLPARGFTLVEMAVSVTILTLLVVAFTQVVNLMSNAWQEGRERVDNYTRARGMLDLISQDIQAALLRSDLGAFVNESGNNQTSNGEPVYAFYTQRSGLSSGTNQLRNLSLVAYSHDGAHAKLQRGDLAVAWSGQAQLLSFGNSTSLPNLSNITYREASPGVVAFRLVFVRANGTVDTLYSPNPAENPVKAIGISLAVIDQATMDKLGSQNLAALTADAVWDLPLVGASSSVANDESVKSIWSSRTVADSSFFTSYPHLRRSLVIFERFTPLMETPAL